jgi:hypothetical protein
MTGFGIPEESARTAAGLAEVTDRTWREAIVYEPRDGGHRAVVLVLRTPATAWRVVIDGLGLDLITGAGDSLGTVATAIADTASCGLLTLRHRVECHWCGQPCPLTGCPACGATAVRLTAPDTTVIPRAQQSRALAEKSEP